MSERSNRPGGLILADTASISRSQSDETIFSPRCSPRVLDSPVTVSYTHQQNVVIEACSAVVEDSWWIPAPSISINWHTHWPWLDCCLNTWAPFSILNWWNFESSTINMASLGLGHIGIVGCISNSVILNISQALIVETSIASSISVFLGAVNKLLFWQINRLSFHKRKWLKSSNSTESPARTTLSLILDWGNHTFWNPIDISSNLLEGLIGLLPLWVIGLGAQISGSELFISQGRKLIESHIVSSLRVGVVRADDLKIVIEDNPPVLVFSFWELNSMFSLPGIILGGVGVVGGIEETPS